MVFCVVYKPNMEGVGGSETAENLPVSAEKRFPPVLTRYGEVPSPVVT